MRPTAAGPVIAQRVTDWRAPVAPARHALVGDGAAPQVVLLDFTDVAAVEAAISYML